jgi:hypothetical protein
MCVFLLVVFAALQQETTLASPRRTSRKPLPGPAALGSLRSPSLRRPWKGRSDREEPNYRTNFTPAQPAVTTVITGASKQTQVLENAAVSDLNPLSPQLHQLLRRFYDESVAHHIRGAY